MDSYLEHLQQAITAVSSGMTRDELTRHEEGKWSAAEVFEHLYLSYTGTSSAFERCLKGGKALGGMSTFKQRVSTFVLTGPGYFPTGRKSPDHVSPRGMPVDDLMANIGPQIAVMDRLIAQCEERYGSRVKLLDHPVLGPLTARQWRKFHWIHGRHHMKQIRERHASVGNKSAKTEKPPA